MSPDRELEKELRDLGPNVEYPPTPDLARAVRRRLDQEGTGRRARSRMVWPSLPLSRWAVGAVALALIVAAPVISPTMRDTLTGRFEAGQTASSGQAAGGADGSPSTRSKEEAVGAPSAARSGAVPGSGSGGRYLGESLGFGKRITLMEARSGKGAPVLLPRAAGLGEPGEVYAGEGGVVLVYRARPGLPPLGNTEVGLVLTERVGGVETAYFPEEVRSEDEFERVEVDEMQGYWSPARRETGLLGGSVLLWEQEGRALRLEAGLSEEAAIRVAESVR